MKEFKKFSTAGGITLLTEERLTRAEKQKIVKENSDVEQFGTITRDKTTCNVEFWGGEFSGAGSMAAAKYYDGVRSVSCCGLDMRVEKSNGLVSMSFPKILIKSIEDTIYGKLVKEEGTAYILLNNDVNESGIDELKTFPFPAIGLIRLIGNKIYPSVFVKSIGTFNMERACISASLAIKYLYPDLKSIEQPSGEVVQMDQSKNGYLVSAKVKLIENLNY